MDAVLLRLADAWEKFDAPLRMRNGFNEESFSHLKFSLQECAEAWALRDNIPRLGANILVDIFAATEGCAGLYDEAGAERIMQAAFELQELVGNCVALNGDELT